MLANNIIKLFKKTKVFLIGDIMLDRYVFGKVSRISPEAPVPVFLTESFREVPNHLFKVQRSPEEPIVFKTSISSKNLGLGDLRF